MDEPTKGIERGRGAYLDYGTRKVPDDGLNDLKIGCGWRKHWTILCPECLTASPYVCGLTHGSVETENGTLRLDSWLLQCPACNATWVLEDEYYDDED